MANNAAIKIHLLDVGPQKYGDAILCEFGKKTVLIDCAHPGNDRPFGDHPSIQSQLAELLGQSEEQLHIDLLVATHAHSDHIGCMPSIVKKGLAADWALVADPNLGWGRAQREAGDSFDSAGQPQQRVIAALREEIHTADEPRDELNSFIDDAATLEPAYNEMLSTLQRQGTRIFRYVGPDDPDLKPLLQQFADLGLEVLGPSPAQLVECAKAIRGRSKDNVEVVNERLQAGDADPIDLYLRLSNPGDLSADAAHQNSPGAYINLQSVILRFRFANRSLLFTGDMQLADPGVSNNTIHQEVAALLEKIKQRGPYDLVKLAHHGSKNGVNHDIFDNFGANVFAICCGSTTDRGHPDPLTLQLLESRPGIQWARTDRNRQSTITFTDSTANIEVAAQPTNNTDINGADQETETAGSGPPESVVVTPSRSEPATILTSTGDQIEVILRLPAKPLHITHTITIGSDGGVSDSLDPISPSPVQPWQLAAGRSLPQLLFVTSREGLAHNIGVTEAKGILTTLAATGHAILDTLPAGLISPSATVSQIVAELRKRPSLKGVVLIGGYDIIPPQQLDCLPPSLRAQVGSTDDDDSFIVWSDDTYGDIDQDGIPELPVSRIPDAKDPKLVRTALAAPHRKSGFQAFGIRNVARPFADTVFATIAGSAVKMFQSRPVVYDQKPAYAARADRMYFMLHGSDLDGSRFWGEGTERGREAVSIDNIPDPCGSVVFTGCCWGALAADTIATRYVPGRPLGVRTAGQSIALTCLLRGATAFVGCTGEHYSPSTRTPGYFGGPLHTAFWRYYTSGKMPAEALLSAKKEYALGMPHGQMDPEPRAIEMKILHQYTCLGLGW
jgi:beta-lactamase superfamily II metal-dependent hydrolase